MADAARHDVHILNSLIETTIDSVDGYERAAREAKNPEFRRIFEERAFERRRVIDEVERGEDFIKNKYEMAMRDDELSSVARETVTRAYDSVKSGHDQISALKHGLDGDRLH